MMMMMVMMLMMRCIIIFFNGDLLTLPRFSVADLYPAAFKASSGVKSICGLITLGFLSLGSVTLGWSLLVLCSLSALFLIFSEALDVVACAFGSAFFFFGLVVPLAMMADHANTQKLT